MATTLKLPFTRFVAQVNTAPAEPKANYQALAARNALALQACEWREASKSVKASLVTHNFTIAHPGDQYDAYLMTGDYSAANSTEIAYAGMAAYRFTLPAAYMSGAQTLVSMSLPITRDRFLLPGARVVPVLSDSTLPSAAWATVRGDASPAASETEYLKNSATRITAALDDSGTLELDLTGADATKKKYLWIYLTVEDYTATWTMYSKTEPRLYAIEGSAMIVGEDAIVTFSADVTPDGGDVYGELNMYSGEFEKWFDLPAGQIDAVYDAGTTLIAGSSTVGARFVAVCGENVASSMPDLPGWALYDVKNSRSVSLDGLRVGRLEGTSPDFQEVDATEDLAKYVKRNGGVKYVRVHYGTDTDGILPVYCTLYTAMWTGEESVGINPTSSLCFVFRYNPETGVISAGNANLSTCTLYIASSNPLFNLERVGIRGGIAAKAIAPSAAVTDSGKLFIGGPNSVAAYEFLLDEGEITWMGNPSASAFGIDGNNYPHEWPIAGTFTTLDGVACNGLAVVWAEYYSKQVYAAYPLKLEFDTWRNLTFHTAIGSNYVLVFGDFTSINGVPVPGSALIVPPDASNLLSPSEDGYTAPDWKRLILPLTYGRIEKPANYNNIEYGISGGFRMSPSSRVACLRRGDA